MKNKQTLILVIVLVALIIISAVLVGYTFFKKNKQEQPVSGVQDNIEEESEPIVVVQKQVEIFKR